jgi:predicted transcriptional regulator
MGQPANYSNQSKTETTIFSQNMTLSLKAKRHKFTYALQWQPWISYMETKTEHVTHIISKILS